MVIKRNQFFLSKILVLLYLWS